LKRDYIREKEGTLGKDNIFSKTQEISYNKEHGRNSGIFSDKREV